MKEKKNLSSTRIVRFVGDILKREILGDSMIEKMGKKKEKRRLAIFVVC
jgi:hypothetical protein